MTYNFDLDGWYEREQEALAMQRDRGELSQAAYEQASRELDRRYDELLGSLNTTADYGGGAGS